ncbi:response regulator, partial [Candidatus Sumerlaeota bacterium]|nr:response regulator [Candidatus Sumerlaeota bacterium]
MEHIRVLIADDHAIFRTAFARNLRGRGYEALEAEDGEEAMRLVRSQTEPLVVVTDLQMRTKREGLEVIRLLKTEMPLVPTILISAVGTFEDGALASQYGAASVFSKSRIEQDVDLLDDQIKRCHAAYLKNSAVLEKVRQTAEPADGAPVAQTIAQLQQYLSDTELDPYVKGEIYERLVALQSAELRSDAERRMSSLIEAPPGAASPITLKQIDDLLRAELPSFDRLAPESRESLRTSEFLYRQQSHLGGDIDFSRNTGFSYCFAVENEAKVVLRR